MASSKLGCPFRPNLQISRRPMWSSPGTGNSTASARCARASRDWYHQAGIGPTYGDKARASVFMIDLINASAFRAPA